MNSQPKHGDVRADGYVFRENKTVIGKRGVRTQQVWLSPEAWERLKQRSKQYRQRNAEAIAQKRRAYYQRPEVSDKVKQYIRDNKERRSAAHAEWYSRNYANVKESAMLSRARARNAVIHMPTESRRIVRTMIAAARRVQACIGIKMSIDHIVPISKGGAHAVGNLQILPFRLNSVKRNREVRALQNWGAAA